MNKRLPESLYTAEQVRRLDYVAIHEFGIPGFDLMSRAAGAVFLAVQQRWPDAKSMLVLCGAGNNGGDGYLVAKLAKEAGWSVNVLLLKDPEALQGDAKTAYLACAAANVDIRSYDNQPLIKADIIIDALLGTGLTGNVRGDFSEVIQRVNESNSEICSVDIPSGLCSDTGAPLGDAVRADLTVSFIGLKQGLLTGFGPEYCGQLVFDDLGIPPEVYENVASQCQRIAPKQFAGLLSPRRRAAHKGDFGHLLLMGGNKGMPGAILMAAESAMSCGAGRVTVATRKQHLTPLAVRCPEVMGMAIDSEQGLENAITGKNVIVIGPGLGKDKWAFKLLKDVLSADCSLVLDADALNLLADHPQLLKGRKLPMIFTPHPGELGRILGNSIADIQKNRFAALTNGIKQLRDQVEGDVTLLLKGAGTLISDGTAISLCSDGNPGMAVAGMGDVLSGVIGALLAQGLKPIDAARMGAWLHATAADDIVARQGEIGLRATELIPVIRQKLNKLIS
ncbi:bifunctional ADP-dependent NAD(P)H-hydrate dehydratase/NAD(P)H-hydrate epimerase [Endozoicomonas ascidiicola]|uniref:bifunctional ADP-dependent NAD(P)H-hydrate dehydratase/NAD(P)H-hydrate epimerase n=1 Tax=Endozoicomonas ascidiicola TaxID=1698521 RepID=UPI0008369B56|nr:bifunctional ADP-dependent NAD(P)H-hydrate dehydratase/NAD(P)H-hydrate epimerase [Endozoicomonas ascidiicola]